ncbi:dephospho-CoA kinase [Nanoarchaeota archaeon]
MNNYLREDETIVLGVTGSMGCGKTTVCEKLMAEAEARGIPTTYISLDDIRREVLGPDPQYADTRRELSDRLYVALNEDGSIDGPELRRKIYCGLDNMSHYKMTLHNKLHDIVHEEIENAHGLVLFEWAMLYEDHFHHWVANNVLLVTCTKEEQMKRLSGGDLTDTEIKRRIGLQMTNDQKEYSHGYKSVTMGGRLVKFDTTSDPHPDAYVKLLHEIVGVPRRGARSS